VTLRREPFLPERVFFEEFPNTPMVKGKSCLASNETFQVRFLVGVLPHPLAG
jgi:hypothetical protein